MKSGLFAMAAFGIPGLASLAALLGAGPGPTAIEEPTGGIAVVELFTSEGCSSCPAADKNLSQIVQRERKAGRRVLALGFHVDYWNSLGHPDRFSDAKFTERQRQYSTRLSGGSTYTPQMVVNGASELVGSDTGKSREAIDRALAEGGVMTLDARSSVHEDKVRITGVLPAALKAGKSRVFAAWVEDGLSTDVRRGENAGRRLVHDAVVRGLESGDPGADGSYTIDLSPPKDVQAIKSRIVVFVQDVTGGLGRVLAAATVDVPGTLQVSREDAK